MRLDPVHRDDCVAGERRLSEVNRLATAQLADLLHVHRGVDGYAERFATDAELAQDPDLALCARPPVGAHGGQKDGFGPLVLESPDCSRHHLGDPGDPATAHSHAHPAPRLHPLFDYAAKGRPERNANVELSRWGGADQLGPFQLVDLYLPVRAVTPAWQFLSHLRDRSSVPRDQVTAPALPAALDLPAALVPPGLAVGVISRPRVAGLVERLNFKLAQVQLGRAQVVVKLFQGAAAQDHRAHCRPVT